MIRKSPSLNPAVALLRKRLPPLEELRMDEEVATYTSMSVPVTPGFVPPRPRCGNPLASMLHFEESSVSIPLVYITLPHTHMYIYVCMCRYICVYMYIAYV